MLRLRHVLKMMNNVTKRIEHATKLGRIMILQRVE